MSTRLVALAATVLAAVSLAACSSSGGDSAPSADVLPGIVLKAADLPSGWKASAHDTSDDADDAANQKTLIACVGGVKDTSADSVKKVNSQDYASGDNSVSSNAELFKSGSDITNDKKLFSSSKAEQCFTTQVRKLLSTSLPSGSTIGTVSIDIKSGSDGGPSNVVGTITGHIEVTVQGQKTTVYEDAAYITGNHIESEVDFTGIGSRVSDSIRSKAIEAVAKRADAA